MYFVDFTTEFSIYLKDLENAHPLFLPSSGKNIYLDAIWLSELAALATGKTSLEEQSNFVGDLVSIEVKEFVSADIFDSTEEHELRYPVELLYNMAGWVSLPDFLVLLKKGYVVMLLQNLQPEHDHVNRTIYVAEAATYIILFSRLFTGRNR